MAVFAQGPIGLSATAGAKLCGATTIIGIDRLPARLEVAQRMEADYVIDGSRTDPVAEIMRLTDHGDAPLKLDQIERAYDLFGHQRDGVLKVAITP